MSLVNEQLKDIASAEQAYLRVQSEVESMSAADVGPMNVDVVTATSTVLGVADRIMPYRDQMAQLPDFDVKYVDNLVSYALAAWYTYVTNLPQPAPTDASQLLDEAATLRGKLLLWAHPLVQSGIFDAAAYAKIKQGSGNKDMASDVVALERLYRDHWPEVQGQCGVTEADLDRAAHVGVTAFALISSREHQLSAGASGDTLRVRAAWTLLDRAYSQCRRALGYLLYADGDVDDIAPSLRHNPGKRASRRNDAPEETGDPDTTETTDRLPGTAGELDYPPVAQPQVAAIGDGASPFARNV